MKMPSSSLGGSEGYTAVAVQLLRRGRETNESENRRGGREI